MLYEYVNLVKTKYNPSVIEYSSGHHLFICGTYQLIDEKSSDISEETKKQVNHRLGDLLLISQTNEIIEEYECFDGGVFDLKIIQFNGNEERIISAHSNGFVAIYSIDLFNKLQTIRRYSTESSLLTCLTIISKELVIVGNSEGKLVTINLSDDSTEQLSVTKFSEPIWTLFCHRFFDNYLLFVGSDDSLMRVYCFDDLNEEKLTKLRPIHTISDSNAGITSFGSDYSSDTSLSLIVGSYDEFIRFYTIEYMSGEVRVNLKNKLHIPESGIWKIILRDGFDNTLLVSGMYSSAHLIVDSKIVQTFDISDNDSDEKHLIYGVNCDSQMKNILFASFYDKSVHLFCKSGIE